MLLCNNVKFNSSSFAFIKIVADKMYQLKNKSNIHDIYEKYNNLNF